MWQHRTWAIYHHLAVLVFVGVAAAAAAVVVVVVVVVVIEFFSVAGPQPLSSQLRGGNDKYVNNIPTHVLITRMHMTILSHCILAVHAQVEREQLASCFQVYLECHL